MYIIFMIHTYIIYISNLHTYNIHGGPTPIFDTGFEKNGKFYVRDGIA